MNYALHFKDYNKVNGSIIDCRFIKSPFSREYIDLAKKDNIKKRNYYIIRSFTNSPWQPAYDFANSIRNELKTKAKLIKQSVNEDIINSLDDYAIAITDFTYNGSEVIRLLFENIKRGGCIVVLGNNNSAQEKVKVLSRFFNPKFLKIKEGVVIIEKTDEVQNNNSVKRTKSNLT